MGSGNGRTERVEAAGRTCLVIARSHYAAQQCRLRRGSRLFATTASSHRALTFKLLVKLEFINLQTEVSEF